MTRKSCFVAALLCFSGAVKAQSVEDGLKSLYYEKYASARPNFEKAITAKPTDERAYYYLGIAELGLENKAGALAAFQKGLQAVPNSPLLTAGMGRIDLLDGKVEAAKQKFAAASTATEGRNGDVARAIADANSEIPGGDRGYALVVMEKLLNNEGRKKKEQYTATAADYIEQGDAYRMLGGENGGKAISTYEKALELDPKNAEAVTKQGIVNYNARLNKDALAAWSNATAMDPNYAPAFQELFEYYFTPKPNQFSIQYAKEFLQKYLAVADPADKQKNEYWLAYLSYRSDDYNDAIAKATASLPQADAAYKAKFTRLIGQSYLLKGDSLAAQKITEDYVKTVGESKLEAPDYQLLYKVYAKLKSPDSTTQAGHTQRSLGYLEKYITADTSHDAEKYVAVAEAYLAANQAAKAGDWYVKVLETKLANKDQVGALDYYNPGKYYLAGSAGGTDTVAVNKAIASFALLAEKHPDISTGHYWSARAHAAKDREAKTGIAKPYFEKYLSMAETDPQKNKTGLLYAYDYLMVYHYNVEDKANLKIYIDKMLSLDPENETVKNINAALKKTTAAAGGTR
jgi:Flp pilus assembly protein TadD